MTIIATATRGDGPRHSGHNA